VFSDELRDVFKEKSFSAILVWIGGLYRRVAVIIGWVSEWLEWSIFTIGNVSVLSCLLNILVVALIAKCGNSSEQLITTLRVFLCNDIMRG